MNLRLLPVTRHLFGSLLLLVFGWGSVVGCGVTAVSQAALNDTTPELLLADWPGPPTEVAPPLVLTPSPSPVRATPMPTIPVRAIGVHYADVSHSRPEMPGLQATAADAGINMVGLNAGRPDWVYFRWPTRPEYWSSAVRSTGIDFLAEDSLNFSAGRLADVHVNAMIDIYAPNYIANHPEAAAISYWGEASPLLVSTAVLTSGPFHDLVLEMIAAIAAKYTVDSISITELSYRIYGYGPDDLALYRAYTGRKDWPRDRAGGILFEHPSIGEWRSAALAGFLAEATAVAQAHGKEFFFDVAVSWGDLANEGREYGHDYATILRAVDRIIVWAYTDLAGYPPEYAGEIAKYLAAHYRPEQVILSVGLWGPNEAVMAPATMATAVAAIQSTAIPHIWITPTSLMSDDHWAHLSIAGSAGVPSAP